MSDVASLLQQISLRLGAIEAQLGVNGGAAAGGSSSAPVGEDPRSIRAFDTYCTESLNPFVEACNKLGGDAETVGGFVRDAWMEMRKFLLMASVCKEPAQSELGPLLNDLGQINRSVGQLVQRNEWEKHTKTCQEGMQCLNWLVVKPAPRDFIESFIGGSDYWANNIRREYRTTNPDQVAFCDTFKKLILELMVYVKEYHTTGVTWNPNGKTVAEFKAGGGAAAAAPAAVPETTTAAAAPAARSSSGGGDVNLFAALNKGGDITSGLKTVTKDQQTWRKEYKGDAAPAPAAKRAAPVPRAAETVKGTPKMEFMRAQHKWCVEYQSSPVEVTITDKKETVYILGCLNATITVTGKCKSIIVDSCKRTAVYFDTAMASCEVVNSQRLNIHCRESVASVAIDKTDGVNVHLPASSMDSTIVASKSSEMNVTFPGPDGEPMERPIPEQYVHRIEGTSVTAEVSDLYN